MGPDFPEPGLSPFFGWLPREEHLALWISLVARSHDSFFVPRLNSLPVLRPFRQRLYLPAGGQLIER